MSYARQMLDAYPVTVTVDADLLAATIRGERLRPGLPALRARLP